MVTVHLSSGLVVPLGTTFAIWTAGLTGNEPSRFKGRQVTMPPRGSALDAARDLLRHGWAPVPIPLGQKRPALAGWQKLRLEPASLARYFTGNGNIGILTGEPSGGLIDIDLDCEEAIVLSKVFLPDTSMWSGRTSRPRSHAWFVVAGPLQSQTFKAPDGATLVELRSSGRQTLVPPSVHPDGDRYEWYGDLLPAKAHAQDLATAVNRLAGATLLARAWPVPGSRHDLANAVAGMLIRAGWQCSEVVEFVRAVAGAAGDEELADRVRSAQATARTLEQGKEATGGPTVAALVGQRTVSKLNAWLGLRVNNSFSSFNSYSGRDSAPWPAPLAQAAFHGLAGRFVELVEPHTEADPAALLLQFLVGFGSLIGRGPHFTAEADRHYTNLFGALVGETSKGRKGTSKGHVNRVLFACDDAWTNYRQQGGLSSGEGLVWGVRDAIVKREPVREKRTIVGYQDVEVDPGVSDKRLLIYEPELASVLRVLGREGNTLSAIVRQAWDTGNLRILTKNSPAVATAAHVSIIGHITRDELCRHLDRTEIANGFANRFLWVCVRRSKCLPDGGKIQSVDLEPFLGDLRQAVDFARELGEQSIQRDERARAMWHEVYPTLSEGEPGLFGAVVSRSEAQVMRLALIYALIDRSIVISAPHLKAALAVWRYAEDSAQYIFGATVGDPVADRILRGLQRSPRGMTRNEIVDLFKRNRTAGDISRGLGLLLKSGLARFEKEETGGRPAERWFAARRYEINEKGEKSTQAPTYELNEVSANDGPRKKFVVESPPARKAATHAAAFTNQPSPCCHCRRRRFWRSVHGPTVCASCHPPAAPELVAEWLEPPAENDS